MYTSAHKMFILLSLIKRYITQLQWNYTLHFSIHIQCDNQPPKELLPCSSMQHFSNKNSLHRHTACCYNKFRQYSMTVKRTYYSTHVELSEHSRIHIITIKFVQIQTTIHPISLDILTVNKWMHAPGSMYALVLRIRCLRA